MVCGISYLNLSAYTIKESLKTKCPPRQTIYKLYVQVQRLRNTFCASDKICVPHKHYTVVKQYKMFYNIISLTRVLLNQDASFSFTFNKHPVADRNSDLNLCLSRFQGLIIPCKTWTYNCCL